jgi:hypothetical protein
MDDKGGLSFQMIDVPPKVCGVPNAVSLLPSLLVKLSFSVGTGLSSGRRRCGWTKPKFLHILIAYERFVMSCFHVAGSTVAILPPRKEGDSLMEVGRPKQDQSSELATLAARERSGCSARSLASRSGTSSSSERSGSQVLSAGSKPSQETSAEYSRASAS